MGFRFDATRYTFRASRLAWRLSVLLLPWQTRFFLEGPFVNGWPWEQGRISFYLSWIPMLLTIALALRRRDPDNSLHLPLAACLSADKQESGSEVRLLPLRQGEVGRGYRSVGGGRLGGVIVGVLLALPLIFTLSPRATFQWLMEVALLVGFVIALMRLGITRGEFAKWFAWSLVPHALLGIWQYHEQVVFGLKWLGIAAQNPLAPGVSVIEVTGHRILRAYGGFPHPNILAGWLAIAIISISMLSIEMSEKRRFQCLALISVFCAAIVLTFSRSALIAAAIGMIFIFIKNRRKNLALFIFALAAILITGWFAREPLFTRVNSTTRLETKSISERTFAWKQGWELFREHPLVGIGPGSTILALSHKEPWNKNDVTLGPPIPPHNVPQLMFIEFGILGLIGAFLLFRFFVVPRLTLHATRYTLHALLLLSLLDHYPWSLWSGKSLAATVFLLTFLPF